MARRRPAPQLDIELEDLPREMRWREWMGRIEAVIFAAKALRLPNTSNFALPGMVAETAVIAMDLEGVAVSSGKGTRPVHRRQQLPRPCF